jgi:hypothetical protein
MPSPDVRVSRTKKKKVVRPITIGWRECVALPDWRIKRLRVKTDTGARSSAIDVTHVQELPENRVRFHVRLSRKYPDRTRAVEAGIVRRTRVRSSNGHAHERIVVRTRVQIGPVLKNVEFTLVWRRNMLCRGLLGRRAIEGDFVVDPASRYLLTERKALKKKGRSK